METNKTQSFSGNATTPSPPDNSFSSQPNEEIIEDDEIENSNEEFNDRCGEIVEKFELIKLIGEGGMGQVYLGQHSLTDRKVAVKILHQEYANNEEILTRIKREAKAAALIGHPNIVEIVDSGTDHYGAPFIAMELLKGASLDEYIDEHGPMAIPLATYIISDILETLDAAHNKGVVHRDIKPENIYMKTRHKSVVPHIKILDFGISKFLTMDKENMSLTKTGTVMGTPFYMSVEQAMGQKIDGRADQYSVAVILYQLLTANLPYFDTNYNRVLLQIVAGEYTPIEQLRNDIPPQLVDVLNKAMAKDRNDRFESCAAFKAALTPFWNQFTPQEIFTQYSDFAAIINENDPLALKTPTPQITDPNLITAARHHTGKKSQTPYSTVTTGEVVLPNNSKSKAILIVVALIGTAFAAYFGISYFQSSDESSDAAMVAAHNEKIEKQNKAEKDPPNKEKKNDIQLPSQVTIQVNNLPEKAKVYLNDTPLEKPFRTQGKKGNHLLRVEADGYKSWYKPVKLLEPNLNLEYDGEKLVKVTKTVKKPAVTNKRKKYKYKKPRIKKKKEKKPVIKKKITKEKKPAKTKSINEADF